MKQRNKKLLSVFGAVCLLGPMTGCETDAEEASASTNATAAANGGAVTSAHDPTTNATPSSLAAPSADGTNATATAEGGTNAAPTVVMKIPPTTPPDVKLTPGVDEIIKLLQSGVSETVVLLYIEKSQEPFQLDAADIVYLNDIGVPPTVLAAMLNHDGADPGIVHDVISTNSVAIAPAPLPNTNGIANLTATAPQVEISSNYFAAPQPGGTIVSDAQQAVAQQPTVVVEQQQPAVVVEQPAVTYGYFYNSLSPYGSWVYVTDYGWCWQPTIAVTHRTWRPYLHGGRWLSSDAGWYWHSDYSWGWAPFHYGRWYCAPRLGWVWTPDYTWGPSWVTWRRSGAYCGWAPLPPRCDVRPGVGFSYWGRGVSFNFNFGYSHDYYAFVPTRHFGHRRPVDHVVPSHNTVNIYKDSTVVNNYIVGNNNTIVNNGIGRDYVASHVRGEIPRVRVADAPANNRTVRPDRLVSNGAETVVYRPNRPDPTLVKAHETAVARTRGEVRRPAGDIASGEATRNNIASRPNRPEPLTGSPEVSASGGVRTPRGASTAPSRTETARPQVARGGSDVPRPVFGTPAPVRPEPDRSREILNSRVTQEARVRPSTTTPVVGGATATTPGGRPETIRPNAGSRNVVPRFENQPNGGESTTLPRGSTRPGAPGVSTPPSGVSRPEIGRGGSTAPANPIVRGGSEAPARTETARPSPAAPSMQSPTTPRSYTPGTRRITPLPEQPSAPAPQASAPNNPPAASPAFARPSVSSSTQPVNRGGRVFAPETARPNQSSVSPITPPANRAAPQITQPSVAQPTRPTISAPSVSAPAVPVQRGAPSVQAPAQSVRPSPRSESFTRPSVPVQRSAPAPNIVQPQPQRVAPSAPVQHSSPSRPQGSSPSYSAPSAPIRSAPSAPAPHFRGGAPSAPSAASRPAPSQSSPQGGRGRLEIGR
ncbi:MAG TPA: DUF6600 domain-containing protein [Verrucomicrobiae bacterium]